MAGEKDKVQDDILVRAHGAAELISHVSPIAKSRYLVNTYLTLLEEAQSPEGLKRKKLEEEAKDKRIKDAAKEKAVREAAAKEALKSDLKPDLKDNPKEKR